MFEFANPKVMALADTVYDKVKSSGVAVWLMKGNDLHIIGHINGPVGREFDRILPPKYTIGHVVFEMNKTLVIDDALTHPLVGKTGAVEDMGIMAYLGTPFHLNGVPVGGISAVHQHARRWDAVDITLLEEAAQALSKLASEASSIVTGR
ncbi:GAF domain-containing protein [Pacificibacter sp. AS14]|uniref:GAF domain-containing protein n=1 Tax=Pacificibacter sp. AS14 TaxID=3135785 RepID=UPI003178266B